MVGYSIIKNQRRTLPVGETIILYFNTRTRSKVDNHYMTPAMLAITHDLRWGEA